MTKEAENPRAPIKAQPVPEAQGTTSGKDQQKTIEKNNPKSQGFSKRKDQKDVLDNMGIDDVQQGIIQGLLDESANKAQRKIKMDEKIDKFLRSDAGENKERQAKEDLTQAKLEYLGEKNKRLDLVGNMMADILQNQYGISMAGGTTTNAKPYPEVLKYVKEMQERYLSKQETFYQKAQDTTDDINKECTFRPKIDDGSMKIMAKEGDRIKGTIKENDSNLKTKRKNRQKEMQSQYKPINKKKSGKSTRTVGEDVVFYDRIMKWYDAKEKAKQGKIKSTIQSQMERQHSPPKTGVSQSYDEQMRYVQKMYSH